MMLKRKLAIASASSLALLAASILPLPQSLTLLLPFATDKSLAVDFPQAINGVRVYESKRLALVVGVDDYPESPLRFCRFVMPRLLNNSWIRLALR